MECPLCASGFINSTLIITVNLHPRDEETWRPGELR